MKLNSFTKGRPLKKLTKKHKRIKEITLSKKDRVYIGLDVHKKSISLAVWINDHIELTFNSPMVHTALIEKLKIFASTTDGLIAGWALPADTPDCLQKNIYNAKKNSTFRDSTYASCLLPS